MKSIIVLFLILCSLYSAYSQSTESNFLFEKAYRLQSENDSLKTKVIKPLRDSIGSLNSKIKELQEQKIHDLERDTAALNRRIRRMERDIVNLNKNRVIGARDSLQELVRVLNRRIEELNQTIQTRNTQIADERRIGEQRANEAEERGQNEVLEMIVNSYRNTNFDDLIKISTKLSVQRDIQFAGNNADAKVKQILSDLKVYFNAEELFSKKINTKQIDSTMEVLKQIKQQSTLIEELKVNIKSYQKPYRALKEMINAIIDLDKIPSYGVKENERQKFNTIISKLTDYMYGHYNYGNYPYLSEIVLELLNRKKLNCDKDITDLNKKLE
ncbi:hypothetical protein [Runella sp.]|uniref:hypothetical protein n=1 Tax=Runella sp. TaxID=1960881 RepID=UPI003019E2C7